MSPRPSSSSDSYPLAVSQQWSLPPGRREIGVSPSPGDPAALVSTHPAGSSGGYPPPPTRRPASAVVTPGHPEVMVSTRPAGSSSYSPAVRKCWFPPCLPAVPINSRPSRCGGGFHPAIRKCWLPPGCMEAVPPPPSRPAAVIVTRRPSGNSGYTPPWQQLSLSPWPHGIFPPAVRQQR